MDIKDKAVVTERDPVQHMASEDKADGSLHRDIKPCSRSFLTADILYNEDKWRKWALEPFDLAQLIDMRNKGGTQIFMHVAGMSDKNGESGFGLIVRDLHGTPIYAYSESATGGEPVSEFYLEMEAADKSLEVVEKLGVKFATMASATSEVAIAVHYCDLGIVSAESNKDSTKDKVIPVSGRIIRKLAKRRVSYEDDVFHFHIFPVGNGRDGNPAVWLAGLAARMKVPSFTLEFDQGSEKLPLASEHLDDLMHLLYLDASYQGLFHP